MSIGSKGERERDVTIVYIEESILKSFANAFESINMK